jgi:hypothetical protein
VIETIRRAALDHFLVLNEARATRVLDEFARRYSTQWGLRGGGWRASRLGLLALVAEQVEFGEHGASLNRNRSKAPESESELDASERRNRDPGRHHEQVGDLMPEAGRSVWRPRSCRPWR